MPRLKAEVVEQRKNFIMTFFAQNPTLKGQEAWDKANEAIHKATGMRMAPDTILELYGKVHADKVVPKAPKMEVIEAKAKMAPGTNPQVGTVVAEDQSCLIAALRAKVAELEDSINARDTALRGLTLANEALKMDNKQLAEGKDCKMRIVDVGNIDNSTLQSMMDAMK